jgi:4-amino-4-deoxy-L-arabinose transferase-like glycosyltransferase
LGLRRYRRDPLRFLHAGLPLVAALVLVLAFALRIGEVERTSYHPVGDARSYLILGGQVAQSGDYSARQRGAGNTRGPTAYFPPAYPYLLAAVDRITGHVQNPTSSGAVKADRLVEAAIGTVIVGLIGLVAFELLGAEVGLVALGIAAIYPVLIEESGVLIAENLLVAFELAAIWAALRNRRATDHTPWVIACGVFTGLAALTHVNGILLVIPLAFAVGPALQLKVPRRLAAPVVLVLATLLTLTPWLVRDGTVMREFVPISDESGITLVGTYNPTSAAADDPPYKWVYFTQIPNDRRLALQAPHLSETQLSSKLSSRALTYIGNHPGAPFAAGFDNTLRLLELEGTHAWRTSAASIGISGATAKIGVISFWLLTLLALGGLVTRAARTIPRWVWGVPLVMWLSVVLVNAETPRFREPLEPFLILLAACLLSRPLAQVTGAISSRYASRA